MALFANDAEAQAVAQRVAAAESRSAGEIVVAVAPRSAEYGRERALFSLVATLLVAVAVYHFLPQVPEAWLLYGQAPLALLGWWVSGLPGVLRRLVSKGTQHEAVRSRAQQLFIQLGVTETKQRSGVLLFFSEAEHRMELLADRGIHERVGADAWQALVESVVSAIRGGRSAAGISAAVDSIGDALAQHFPPDPADTNELSDAVTRV